MIGIALTVYFSLFYIPGYLREMTNARIQNINNELIESVQELVYNKHEIDVDDLNTMIKGKELKYDVIYPFSTDELLIQTQDKFIENKFIPLKERKGLIEDIDLIRSRIKTQEPKEPVKEKQDWLAISSMIASVIIGIIASILGSISLYYKSKKQKEYELANNIDEKKEEIESEIKSSLSFESVTEDVLNKILPSTDIQSFSRDVGVDFILRSDSERWAIEVKYQSRPVSTQTIRRVLSFISNSEFRPMLITNAPLTRGALEEIKLYNLVNAEKKFTIVKASTTKELEANLRKLFEPEA